MQFPRFPAQPLALHNPVYEALQLYLQGQSAYDPLAQQLSQQLPSGSPDEHADRKTHSAADSAMGEVNQGEGLIEQRRRKRYCWRLTWLLTYLIESRWQDV